MVSVLNDSQIEKAVIQSYELATNSKDPSTQNGAVLLDGTGWEVGVGWNHFPSGVSDDHWTGPKEAKYARVVHAEVAAIIDAARRNGEAIGGVLVCGWAACSNCAKHIADTGIKELIRHTFVNSGGDVDSHWYNDVLLGDEIMHEAGVDIIEVDLVPYDIELRRNGKVWNPSASE